MAHTHAHGHGHGSHSHSHDHTASVGADGTLSRSFKIAAILNTLIVLAQAIYGFAAHSLALLSDAGHNLTDVLGLLLAWGAFTFSQRPPSKRRTYGLRRSTILASLGNAILLLLASGGIIWEAMMRLSHPEEVNSSIVMWVAGITLIFNGISAWLFMREGHDDLNVRSAFLHMASDAAISLGVLLSALLLKVTGYLWIDPIVSIIIVVVIAWGTWGILKESFNLAMDAVPKNTDLPAIENFLRQQEGVSEVHDLHIWAMSTTETVLTAHLVMPNHQETDHFLHDLCDTLQEKYRISHTTIQIERGTSFCHLAAENVV